MSGFMNREKVDFTEMGKARASFSHVHSVASKCKTETHLARQKQTKVARG